MSDPSPAKPIGDAPAVQHAARAREFHAQAADASGRAGRLSTARLLAFVAAVLAFLGAHDLAGAPRWALTLAGIALALGFVALVGRHRKLIAERDWYEELARGSELALARIRRDWNALPPPQPREAPAGHPYAADVDVFGHASLMQLLGSVCTVPGRNRLVRWLSTPSPVPELLERQAAVAELAPQLDLRDGMAARGRLIGRQDAGSIADFLDWASGERWLERRPLLRLAAWAIPGAIVVLVALQIVGVLKGAWWAFGLLATGIVTARTVGRIHRIYELASAGEAGIAGYAGVLQRFTAGEFQAPLLRRLREEVAPAGHEGAAQALRRLERILEVSETRESNLAYMVVQFLFLWDLHVLAALERWQSRWGTQVAGWIHALGQADALAALAALAHDHPDWAFPRLLDASGPRVVQSEALGHPLLSAETGVRNDVQVGPAGTFLLVTGSNMSGKSTLLRAIGLDVVLAQAGGPVCAASMVLPPLELWTSMRITDSLERGLSHFMAELERLKEIVDAARRVEASSRQDGRVLLYLVDEVLQGTNSAERQVAARRIIRHLVDHGAIGAVTTHDLELADAPELADAVVAVHFRETVHTEGAAPPLTFDYRLRPGVATSRNALKLMEIVGLVSER